MSKSDTQQIEEQIGNFPTPRTLDEAYQQIALLKVGFFMVLKSLAMRGKWIKWVTRVTAGLGAGVGVVVIALIVVTSFYRDLSSGNSPSGIARRQTQAENIFILCSRDSTVVDIDKQEQIESICEGYDTLTEAYETQGVPDPED